MVLEMYSTKREQQKLQEFQNLNFHIIHQILMHFFFFGICKFVIDHKQIAILFYTQVKIEAQLNLYLSLGYSYTFVSLQI